MTARSCVSCGGNIPSGSSPRRLTCSAPCARECRRVNETRYRLRVRAARKEIPVEQECYGCKKLLPAAAFHRNRSTVSGLQGLCKQCRKEYDRRPDQVEKAEERKQFWYLLHHEELNQSRRDRYHTDEEFRAHQNAEGRARYHAHPKARIDRCRELRQARRQWEREGGRVCVCGRAIPAESEEGPWFCRPACKARLLGQVLRGGTLGPLLKKLRAASDEPRISPEDEGLILGIARNTAARWYGRGPAVADEDLLSAAYLGAWNAWLIYDSRKGASLKTWLIYGARSEVLEALRKADPLSRKERREYREALERDSGTPVPRQILSLDAMIYEDPEGAALQFPKSLMAVEDEAPRVVERIHAEELAARAFVVVRGRDAEVLQLVGIEGLSMQQTAQRLGISESRVGQLWARAKARVLQEVAG